MKDFDFNAFFNETSPDEEKPSKFGTAVSIEPKKDFDFNSFVNDGKEEEDDDDENVILESTLSKDSKLTTDDLYKTSNLNIIRDFMSRRKGIKYEDLRNEKKLVDDFVDHMRWFNTNTLSTAGEIQFVRKGNDADRAAAAEAYNLYDSLGNLFNRGETLYGKIDGIKDYVFAAAVDPSSWFGLFTGGVGKAATLGFTQAQKKLVQQATQQAYKEAVKKGVSSEATRKAVATVQKDMIEKLGANAVNSQAGKLALKQAAMDTKRQTLKRLGMTAVKDLEKKRRKKAARAELTAAFGADATIAAFQDVAIQDIYLDVNVDDKVDSIDFKQTMFNSLMGGAVAPAFSLAGRGARAVVGKSNLNEALEKMSIEKFASRGVVDPEISFKATKVIREGYKSWAEKVKAGKEIRGNQMMPEGLLGEILLGPQGETGLVGLLRKQNITVNKNTFISDFLTDVIRVMPEKEFLDMSKDFEAATGLQLGDVATAKVKLSDVIASYASGLGRELSVLAQAKNKLNAGVVIGNDVVNQALDRKEIRDTLEDGLTGYLLQKKGSFAEGAKVSLKSNKNKKGKILSIKDGKAVVVFEDAKKKVKGDKVKGPKTPAAREYTADELNIIPERDLQPKTAMYLQNVWRRTLVSSIPTTAANVFGWSQYYLGQTVADSLNGGLLFAYGALTPRSKSGKEALRMSKVLFQVQADKLRNLLDPFTTHDAYVKFLDENKDIKGLIHETAGGTGIEIYGDRYDVNQNNPILKGIEFYADASMKISGVRAQDTFTKSQMFMTELDKNLRLKQGVSLADTMRSNNLEAINEDVLGASLDTTMKSVFSKDYTTIEQGEFIRSTAKFVESISNLPVLGSVLPFGRFFNNVIATVYQLGPARLLTSTAAIMRGDRSLTTMDAFGRAAVGTAGLYMASRLDQDRHDKGLGSTTLDVGAGTTIDIKNAFPMSEFMAMGRVLNQAARAGSLGGAGKLVADPVKPVAGEESPMALRYPDVSPTAITEAMEQIGIGQFARDIQFGNDMNRILDMVLNSQSSALGAAELSQRAGSFLAGFTRPLQIVDKSVGFLMDTDIHRDKKQKLIVNEKGEEELVNRSGFEIGFLEATRYMTNILNSFEKEADKNDFRNLRVAVREGDLYDPNPLASLFGVKVKPAQTATERVYTLADVKDYKASSRTQIAAYDRVLNEILAPILERRSRALLADKKFMKGTNTLRREMLDTMLKKTRRDIKKSIDIHEERNGGLYSPQTYLSKKRYDTLQFAGSKTQMRDALRSFHNIRVKRKTEQLEEEGRSKQYIDNDISKMKQKGVDEMSETELFIFKKLLSAYKEEFKDK